MTTARSARLGRSVPALLVLLGLAAFVWGGLRAPAERTQVAAEGSFWTARARSGKPLAVAPGEAGLLIGPGDSFALREPDGARSRLATLKLVLQRTGAQSSYVRIHFREQGQALYRAFVLPGPTLVGALAYEAQGRPAVPLDSVPRGRTLDDPAAPFELALRLDGPRLAVDLDGAPILEAQDARLDGGKLSVWADGIRILSASVTGTSETAGGRQPFEQREDFSALNAAADAAEVPRWLRVAGLLGTALAALAVAAAWLAALCVGRPSPGTVLQATAVLAVPAAVLCIVACFVPVPAFLPILCVLSALALLPALFVLQEHLRTPVRLGGAGRVRAVAVVLLIAAVTAWVAGVARARALQPLADAEQAARASLSTDALSAGPQAEPGPIALDASNALDLDGTYRSFALRATVVLQPDSMLEVRCHSPRRLGEGVALYLSTDAACPTGFVLENDALFRPIGNASGVVAAGRPLRLELRVRGSRFEAAIDGVTVADARERRDPAGAVTLLAARGGASVQELTLEPAAEAEPAGVLGESVLAGAAPVAWLLLLSAAASALLGLAFLRALEALAFALLPLAIAIHAGAVDGRLEPGTYWLAVLASVLLLLVVMLLHATSRGAWRVAALLALGLAGTPLALGRATLPSFPSDEAAGPGGTDFDVAHLAPGLVHLQHPLLRHFNTWLEDHRFRGRSFGMDKPAGTARVICIGSSSTWGHGIDESTGQDYPTLLEGRLAARHPEQPVQVINGAVRGSGSARLYRFLDEVLLQFHPDVVTVSLFFNDEMYLGQCDEGRYFERVTAPDYSHSLLDRLALRRALDRTLAVQTRFFAAQPGSGDSSAAWRLAAGEGGPPSPAECFERNLRQIAGLLQARGVALVLITEPVRGNHEHRWQREFHAVMDRLGAELGLPVVDPGPALQAAGGAALFMDEVHPLPAGNQVTADVLAPVIEQVLAQRATPPPR